MNEMKARVEAVYEAIAKLKRLSQTAEISEEITRLEGMAEKLEEMIGSNLEAWDRVMLARMVERPRSRFYIETICEDFMEFHGDRVYADDSAIIGGIGTIGGRAITIIGESRGKNAKENIEMNFGMPHPEGYRKALRLMKQAEKFKRPVICLIDTPGAYCGIEAEERGQGATIAKNLFEMSKLATPIISGVIGEGGSGGALALGVSDKVFMQENAVYSILSPEGFASILWKDASKTKEAASKMKLTAYELLQYGIIDDIILEPAGGAHKNPTAAADVLKQYLISQLDEITAIDLSELVQKRYEKFRKLGVFLNQ